MLKPIQFILNEDNVIATFKFSEEVFLMSNIEKNLEFEKRENRRGKGKGIGNAPRNRKIKERSSL